MPRGQAQRARSGRPALDRGRRARRLDGVRTSAASARSFASQGKDQPAKLAEQAAERAESLGDYLQRTDGDTILRDLEDFGRRQPWAVIAGGLALGFAASRFLKASSSRRYEQAPSSNGTPQPRRPAPIDDPRRPWTTADVRQRPGFARRRHRPSHDPDADLPPQAPGTGLYTDGVSRGA